jgi:hypothetical protein
MLLAVLRVSKEKSSLSKAEIGGLRISSMLRPSCRFCQAERARTIDQVLRDYRNFVHPKKEIRAEHACSEAEALLAKGALDGVCNYFEKVHSTGGNSSRSGTTLC